MSALGQLRLIVVGATIGAIGGSVVLRPSDDLGPLVVAATAAATLLGVSFVVQWFASQPLPQPAPAYSSLIGRAVVTLAAALSVVLAFNLLVASDTRGVPAPPNARATVAPVVPFVPIVPASPQPSARSPAPTPATSSAPRATVVPVSSPAATSSVSPFATPAASQPAPPPATPQPTSMPAPTSVIPTLPPLPTIRLP